MDFMKSVLSTAAPMTMGPFDADDEPDVDDPDVVSSLLPQATSPAPTRHVATTSHARRRCAVRNINLLLRCWRSVAAPV
jgi:hypothetical protein